MSEKRAIEEALASAGFDASVSGMRELSGGCIHRVLWSTGEGGLELVAKINSADQLALFEEEVGGLRALRETQAIMVPKPLAVGVFAGHAVLLMTGLKPGRSSDEAWRSFGGELAAMHGADAGDKYGFPADNHLGTTLQRNTFSDDWVEFNADCRLGFQVDLAKRSDLLTAEEERRLRVVIGRLEELIPRRPKPSLLHGDLWSGNALPTVNHAGRECVGIIDPACYIGDGWADIAMMKLFGGFFASCFDAYGEAVGDNDRVESRIAVYQLYHLLNHMNIFGRGYAGQAMAVAANLGA